MTKMRWDRGKTTFPLFFFFSPEEVEEERRVHPKYRRKTHWVAIVLAVLLLEVICIFKDESEPVISSVHVIIESHESKTRSCAVRRALGYSRPQSYSA